MSTATQQHALCPPPDPGIYENVPAEEYHSWNAASKSRLWNLRKSPAHLKWMDQHGSPKTDALRFGDAFDCAVFEPADFDARFVMSKPCEALLKSGARKGEPCGNAGVGFAEGQWLCGQHGGKPDQLPPDQDVLSHIEMWKIRKMRESLESDDMARELLAGRGKNQLSVVWDDPTTGVRCKARIDRLTAYQGYSTHVDLKSAKSAEPTEFERDAGKYGYFVQAAHYRAGCEVIDAMSGRSVRHRRFMFLVVEKEPDLDDRFRVEVFEPEEASVEAGLKIRDRLLSEYATCLATDVWPYRPRKVHTLVMPKWQEQEAEIGV